MDSSERIVFRGRAFRHGANSSLRIVTSQVLPDLGTNALELAGNHSKLAATILEFASLPITVADLVPRVATRREVGVSIVIALLERLVAHNIIQRLVPAEERVRLEGEGVVASTLWQYIRLRDWPRDASRVTILTLGTLGGPQWRQCFVDALRLKGEILSVSLEREGAWVGPLMGRSDAPCPGCLLSRRIAVEAAVEADGLLVAHNPAVVGLACEYALLGAEQLAFRRWPTNQVLYVSESGATLHTLLSQPSCLHCVRPATSGATVADQSEKELVSAFLRDWEREDNDEPSDAVRAPFLDKKLGPIEIKQYRAPGLFRDLPLVLGSIRFTQPHRENVERRELFSVTFGTGMTESRQHLVAFAEGIERYALNVDQPDIAGARFSDLSPLAVSPNDTVRFLPGSV